MSIRDAGRVAHARKCGGFSPLQYGVLASLFLTRIRKDAEEPSNAYRVPKNSLFATEKGDEHCHEEHCGETRRHTRHVHEEYAYPPSADVIIHPDDWRWREGEHHVWREHPGRGYWRGGAWAPF
jgi:hypothetical protein